MEFFQRFLLDPFYFLKNAEKSTKKYGAVPSKLFTFTRIVGPD
jgi:hypothetical protein